LSLSLLIASVVLLLFLLLVLLLAMLMLLLLMIKLPMLLIPFFLEAILFHPFLLLFSSPRHGHSILDLGHGISRPQRTSGTNALGLATAALVATVAYLVVVRVQRTITRRRFCYAETDAMTQTPSPPPAPVSLFLLPSDDDCALLLLLS
jgi:hypothetical protein